MTKRPKLANALANVQAERKRKLEEAKADKAILAKKQKSNLKSQKKVVIPFESSHSVLLVGEGNFSFASSLVKLGIVNIIATSFDSEEIVHEKYNDAKDNIETLESVNVMIYYDIDATKLEKYKIFTEREKFDRIVFNFPHTGSGITDQDRNILLNQRLIVDFLQSAYSILSPYGAIILTTKDPNIKPYSLWNVRQLIKDEIPHLAIKTSFIFDHTLYPGYVHRRTLGYKDGVSTNDNTEIRGNPRTYVIVDRSQVEQDIESSRKGMEKKKTLEKKDQRKRRRISS